MLPIVTKMMRYLISNTISKNKALLMHELEKVNGFMRLLMKPRNTREKWTHEERKVLRRHLWRISSYIPALMIFALPFGSLLFPVLAEVLDRRKKRRGQIEIAERVEP